MPAYSFLDVFSAVTGPGLNVAGVGIGTLPLSGGVGAAKEGIKIKPKGDKNVMTKGADGKTQHSLIADDSADLEVHLQQTSPLNGLLMKAYRKQKRSSLLWGRMTVRVANPVRGDMHNMAEVAFRKVPDLDFADEAGNVVWMFDVGDWDPDIGLGVPGV
jgi:hypothetical protein